MYKRVSHEVEGPATDEMSSSQDLLRRLSVPSTCDQLDTHVRLENSTSRALRVKPDQPTFPESVSTIVKLGDPKQQPGLTREVVQYRSSDIADLSSDSESYDTDSSDEEEELPGSAPVDPLAYLRGRTAKQKTLLAEISEQLRFDVAATTRLNQINQLLLREFHPKTMVGVVGSTGAGKSALLNALLEEEQIVPTSPMGACTATPIEVSWNNEDDFPYKVIVEFISPGEWRKELIILMADLQCEDQDEVDPKNAAIAREKVRAVYPSVFDDLSSSISVTKIEELMSDVIVGPILGQTHPLEFRNARGLYLGLQTYIGTRPAKQMKKTNNNKYEMWRGRYWPLIKVVKIFTKSPILETGIVLVDLPGVHDSNEARAAVAENYIRLCSHTFIVSPIIRAQSDKSASDFLDSMICQLQMDGKFGSMTFICTKTDDLNVEEIQDQLNSSALDEIQAKQEDAETQITKVKKKISFAKKALKASSRSTVAGSKRKFDESDDATCSDPKGDHASLRHRLIDEEAHLEALEIEYNALNKHAWIKSVRERNNFVTAWIENNFVTLVKEHDQQVSKSISHVDVDHKRSSRDYEMLRKNGG